MDWLVGLATIVGSGVTASFATNILGMNKEHMFYMRQRAEELYVSAESFETLWGAQCLMLNRVVINQITYNEMLDLQKEQFNSETGQLHRKMIMLTRIYFPEVEPQLNALFKARGAFNDMTSAHKEAYRGGLTELFSWKDHFQPLVDDFDKATRAYKDAIVLAARGYASKPRWWNFIRGRTA